METQLAYDNGIVLANPLYPICGDYLYAVANRDYKKSFFGPEIACLDMDKCETLTAINEGREKLHTVDAAIGVKKYQRNKFSKSSLLLVELRMNYRTPHNLSKRDLENKVSHSKGLLSDTGSFYPRCLFIFSDDVINQMVNWFKNKAHEGGLIRKCDAVSVSEFNGMIKSEKDFPYQPITDLGELRKTIEQGLTPWSPDVFFKALEYWLDKANSYRYNQSEYLCIRNEIERIWQVFKSSGLDLSEEDEIRVEIIEEDYF